MTQGLTVNDHTHLSPDELMLMRLCSAAVDLGITVADGTAPGFERDKPEDEDAMRQHARALTQGVELPVALSEEPDAQAILLAEVVACTNAAVAQRLRDRAWQRADGSPPWRDRHVRRAWETLLMRLADAGFRIPGRLQTGLVAKAEAVECYRLSETEFRTGWIAGEPATYQWCVRRSGETVSIGRRVFASRSFEKLLELPAPAVERLAAFLNAVV
jgi:hypothetical protein